jgi:hypothetical protein
LSDSYPKHRTRLTKEMNKGHECYVYTRWSRVSSPVQLAVLAEPCNVPGKSRPYTFCYMMISTIAYTEVLGLRQISLTGSK